MELGGNLDISVPTGPRAAGMALAAVRDFLGRGPDNPELAARLAIIVEELVLNIVEHGRPPPDDRIDIGLARTGRGVRLTIGDGGAFFDPRNADPPGDPPPDRGGGAGLALVRAWADILSCDRRDGRNRMVLDIIA